MRISFLLTLLLVLVACTKNEDNAPKFGAIQLDFNHFVDGSTVLFDEMRYENAAGNTYEVTEVQWFISDVELIGDDVVTNIQEDENIHYIDTNLPVTMSWTIEEGIPQGTYHSLRFTFGLKAENNTVGRFPDLPESNMIWPYHMGGDNGGYHYMKLNGFWIDTLDVRQPFNFHLGVGSTEAGGQTTFHQNWFETTIPVEIHVTSNQEVVRIPIEMHIENWFREPNVWDWDVIGPKIMRNQEAMAKGIANGRSGTFTTGQVDIIPAP